MMQGPSSSFFPHLPLSLLLHFIQYLPFGLLCNLATLPLWQGISYVPRKDILGHGGFLGWLIDVAHWQPRFFEAYPLVSNDATGATECQTSYNTAQLCKEVGRAENPSSIQERVNPYSA